MFLLKQNEESNIYEGFRERLMDCLDWWKGGITDRDVMDFAIYDFAITIQNYESFKLYKYTKSTLHTLRNIEKQQLFLSANGMFNDIYEGLPYDMEGNITPSQTKSWGDLAYICCLSEICDDMLMWSHYADAHKGICIEYDLKQLHDSKCNILEHIFPVIYKEDRIYIRDLQSLIDNHELLKECIAVDAEYDGTESLDDILPMFLTKGKTWEYEREWRIVYSLKQLYDAYLNIRDKGVIVPFQCISGIYLGYRIDPDIKDMILEICQRLSAEGSTNIPVYQATISNEKYSLAFNPLNLWSKK